MAEIDGVEYGAIRFSEGIEDGLPGIDAPEPGPAPVPEPEDVAPTEHHNILTTPVEMPQGPKAKRKTAIQQQLEGMYAMAGTLLFMKDPQSGAVILEQGPQCAAALNDLAQKNPAVKRALESMLATSAWSAVIAAHLPIAIQLGTTYVPELRRRYSATVGDDSAAA